MPLFIQWNRRTITQFDDAIAYIENDSDAMLKNLKETFFTKLTGY